MDNELLISKISDAIFLSETRKKNCYVGFLNDAEIFCAENYLKHLDNDYMFWGGYESAQRKFFCSLYNEFKKSDVPLSALDFSYRKADKLSYSDFLGTLMSLGIERDTIGDILIENGKTVVFVKSDIKDYICSQITKVGGVGVNIRDADLNCLPDKNDLIDKSVIVPSMRLDAVVSALTGLSREKSQKLISQGNVFINYTALLNSSAKIKENNVLTIRKSGKYIIKNIVGETKKGRLKLLIQIFR